MIEVVHKARMYGCHHPDVALLRVLASRHLDQHAVVGLVACQVVILLDSPQWNLYLGILVVDAWHWLLPEGR